MVLDKKMSKIHEGFSNLRCCVMSVHELTKCVIEVLIVVSVSLHVQTGSRLVTCDDTGLEATQVSFVVILWHYA
jgi:hypothetical protein